LKGIYPRVFLIRQRIALWSMWIELNVWNFLVIEEVGTVNYVSGEQVENSAESGYALDMPRR